ncbi:hypothetical protein B0H11DRAFT_2276079 [Mycena galericulata]|nr:hypothetical protein B0H11DRAFT_2276079 [Mycena galericulata]
MAIRPRNCRAILSTPPERPARYLPPPTYRLNTADYRCGRAAPSASRLLPDQPQPSRNYAANTTPTKRRPSRRANTAERRATHNAVEGESEWAVFGVFFVFYPPDHFSSSFSFLPPNRMHFRTLPLPEPHLLYSAHPPLYSAHPLSMFSIWRGALGRTKKMHARAGVWAEGAMRIGGRAGFFFLLFLFSCGHGRVLFPGTGTWNDAEIENGWNNASTRLGRRSRDGGWTSATGLRVRASADVVYSIFLEGVHSLLLYQSVDSEDMLAILRICAKTTNLSVYNDNVDPSLCPYISAMPLKKLAINFRRLMSNPVRLQDTCGELFSHLTHLDIITAVGDEEPWEQWSSLSHLPSLTHLSFNYGLPCFLVQAYKNAVLDWEAGATGGQDFWERADAFFDKKQKREIDLHIIHRPNGPLAAEV